MHSHHHWSTPVLFLYALCVAFAARAADDSAIEVFANWERIQNRFVSTKGQRIFVVVKNSECRFNDVKFEEKKRNSRVADDLTAVLGKVIGGAQVKG